MIERRPIPPSKHDEWANSGRPGTQEVNQINDGSWLGACYHVDTAWVIERGTEEAAWRSLRSHSRDCPERTTNAQPTNGEKP